MSRRGVARHRRPIALALAGALIGAVLATSSAGSAVRRAPSDRSAVLRVGAAIADNGGVTFDPSNSAANPIARGWMDLIYDTMIHETADGKGAPGLATAWKTPDAEAVELTLRDGVTFTDGAPFNAAAVKAAWDRLLASQVPTIPAEIKAITAVETPDDRTVRIRLNKPASKQFVDETLTNSFWLGVPSPAAAQSGTLNAKPVGAGPYVLKGYEDGQRLSLARNPRFYDPGAQKLAGIDFVQIPWGAQTVTALQTGQVDLIGGFDPSALETIKSQPHTKVAAVPSSQVYDLGLCTSSGPFGSKEARQALQYALDRKAINTAAFSGEGSPTVLPLTKASSFYNPSLEKTYPHDPKKAKALFKQAGVAPGTTIHALVPVNPPHAAIAEVVQNELKDIGLNLEITQSANFVTDASRLRPDMAFVFMDPSFFTIAFENTGTALNVCDWKSAEAVAALTAARDGSKSEAEQRAAWDSFQKVLLDDSPVVFTVAAPLLAAYSDKVKGLRLLPGGGTVFGDVSMTK